MSDDSSATHLQQNPVVQFHCDSQIIYEQIVSSEVKTEYTTHKKKYSDNCRPPKGVKTVPAYPMVRTRSVGVTKRLIHDEMTASSTMHAWYKHGTRKREDTTFFSKLVCPNGTQSTSTTSQPPRYIPILVQYLPTTPRRFNAYLSVVASTWPASVIASRTCCESERRPTSSLASWTLYSL